MVCIRQPLQQQAITTSNNPNLASNAIDSSGNCHAITQSIQARFSTSSKVSNSLELDTPNTTGRSPKSENIPEVGKILAKILTIQPTVYIISYKGF
jgi:hypothetical protein